ncbi:MAG: T9SS type A sorting domain-containing protein [candidate division Zixibacteria bacterium]|nr:T9SS type A sorting domain-containing protein [candidate division Zixibacteria bacterium]
MIINAGGIMNKFLITITILALAMPTMVLADDHNMLIAVPADSSELADDYIELFDEFGFSSSVTNDLLEYEGNLHDFGVVFLLDYSVADTQTLNLLSEFLDESGNLYFRNMWFEYENYEEVEQFLMTYFPVGWTTCETFPFTWMHGVDGTFMEGYSFQFSSQHWGSNVMPYGGGNLEVVVEDNSQVCGCVSIVSHDYKIIASEHDLENIMDNGYPNNVYGLFEKFFEYFGIEITGLDEEAEGTVPGDYAVISNYPNPFNSGTHLSVEGVEVGLKARLAIYNILGEEIIELPLGNEGGVTWNGVDRHGNNVPSGVYFARLKGSTSGQALKMTLMK